MLSFKQDFHVVVNQLSYSCPNSILYSCPCSFNTAAHAVFFYKTVQAIVIQLSMQLSVLISTQLSCSCPCSCLNSYPYSRPFCTQSGFPMLRFVKLSIWLSMLKSIRLPIGLFSAPYSCTCSFLGNVLAAVIATLQTSQGQDMQPWRCSDGPVEVKPRRPRCHISAE
jgi:hypothetical protein